MNNPVLRSDQKKDYVYRYGYHGYRWVVAKDYVSPNHPIHFLTVGDDTLCYEKKSPLYGCSYMKNVTCIECRKRLVKLFKAYPNAR